MKACNVSIKPLRAPIIREIIWTSPTTPWIKINIDGTCIKKPIKVATGGNIRNDQGLYLGCFAQCLGEESALVVELCDTMTTIELAASKGFWNVWLLSDSQLVLQAFKANTTIPWKPSNRWYNCCHITRNMRLFASHI